MIEGRDYVLVTRFAAGEYDRFPDLARELAQAGVSIIMTNTIASVRVDLLPAWRDPAATRPGSQASMKI